MAGREGAVEQGGSLGEFERRQLEKLGRGSDELGGDVASAAGATHVVEGLRDGGQVKGLGGMGTVPIRGASIGNSDHPLCANCSKCPF